MVDWLDSIVLMDDAVTEHLGDDGVFTKGGVDYPVRGPFDRIYVDEGAGDARTAVLRSVISIQPDTVPDDPREGTLVIRGESFVVVDFDDQKNGRIVLILDKHAAT